MKNFFLLLFFTVLIQSCSIQKRKHLPGYHLSFNKNLKSSSKKQNFDNLYQLKVDTIKLTELNSNENNIEELPLDLVDVKINNEETFSFSKTSKIEKNKTNDIGITTEIKLKINKTKLFDKSNLQIKKWNKNKFSNEDEEYEQLAVIGFIISISFFFIPLVGITPIIGLILCNRALKGLSKDNKKRKMAKAGKILSIISLIISIIMLLALLITIIIIIGSMSAY